MLKRLIFTLIFLTLNAVQTGKRKYKAKNLFPLTQYDSIQVYANSNLQTKVEKFRYNPTILNNLQNWVSLILI